MAFMIFSPEPYTISFPPGSVVKPFWCGGTACRPPALDSVPLPSQELPQQAIGPCTMWAVSAIGWSTIMAPSKAQDSPPRARHSFSFFSTAQPPSVSLSTVDTIARPPVATKSVRHFATKCTKVSKNQNLKNPIQFFFFVLFVLYVAILSLCLGALVANLFCFRPYRITSK